MADTTRDEALELAWLAGVFDGEGCVTFRLSSYGYIRYAIGWGVQHPEGAQRYSRILEALGVQHKTSTRKDGQQTVVITRNEEMIRFCELVIPHATIKRDELEVALDTLRWIEETDQAHGFVAYRRYDERLELHRQRYQDMRETIPLKTPSRKAA